MAAPVMAEKGAQSNGTAPTPAKPTGFSGNSHDCIAIICSGEWHTGTEPTTNPFVSTGFTAGPWFHKTSGGWTDAFGVIYKYTTAAEASGTYSVSMPAIGGVSPNGGGAIALRATHPDWDGTTNPFPDFLFTEDGFSPLNIACFPADIDNLHIAVTDNLNNSGTPGAAPSGWTLQSGSGSMGVYTMSNTADTAFDDTFTYSTAPDGFIGAVMSMRAPTVNSGRTDPYVVQKKQTIVSSGTSTTVVLDQTVKSGNALILASLNGGQISAVSDGHNTWTRAANAPFSAPGGKLDLWVAPDAAAAATTVTVTFASGDGSMVVMEVANLLSSSPVDLHPTGQTLSASTTPTAASMSPSVAWEFIVSTWSPGTGVYGNGNYVVLAQDLVETGHAVVVSTAPTTASTAPSVSTGGVSDAESVLAISLKPGAGSPPPVVATNKFFAFL